MNGHRKARGFTLIELLVTVAIITILVSIGIPMYSTFTQDAAISGATAELIASLNDARSRAASERKTIRVQALSGDWKNGWETVRVSDSATLFTTKRAGDGGKVAITEASAATTVDFNLEGRAAAARTFTIAINKGKTGSAQRVLSLNIFGRVSVDATPHP